MSQKHDDEPRRRDDDRPRSSSHRDVSRHTRDDQGRARERTRERDRPSHRSSRDYPMEERHVRDSRRTSEDRYRRGSDDRGGSRHSEVPRERNYGAVQVVEKVKKEYRSDHSFEDGELSS